MTRLHFLRTKRKKGFNFFSHANPFQEEAGQEDDGEAAEAAVVQGGGGVAEVVGAVAGLGVVGPFALRAVRHAAVVTVPSGLWENREKKTHLVLNFRTSIFFLKYLNQG